MARRTITLPFAVHLGKSMRLLRLGRADPTIVVRDDAVMRASRTPMGPATLRAQLAGDVIEVEAWGDGAEWALEQAPAMRSEEHTSELQSLMRISYAVFCLKKQLPQPQQRQTTITISTRYTQQCIPHLV